MNEPVLLGGAIPNRTGDLSRAVGAVKSLTTYSSWSTMRATISMMSPSNPVKLRHSLKASASATTSSVITDLRPILCASTMKSPNSSLTSTSQQIN